MTPNYSHMLPLATSEGGAQTGNMQNSQERVGSGINFISLNSTKNALVIPVHLL